MAIGAAGSDLKTTPSLYIQSLYVFSSVARGLADLSELHVHSSEHAQYDVMSMWVSFHLMCSVPVSML